jgi:hypothetical protein
MKYTVSSGKVYRLDPKKSNGYLVSKLAREYKKKIKRGHKRNVTGTGNRIENFGMGFLAKAIGGIVAVGGAAAIGYAVGGGFGGGDDQVVIQDHTLANEVVTDLVSRATAKVTNKIVANTDVENRATIKIGDNANLGDCNISINQNTTVKQELSSFLDQEIVSKLTQELVADIQQMLTQSAELTKVEGGSLFPIMGDSGDQIVSETGNISNSFKTGLTSELTQIVESVMESEIFDRNNAAIELGSGLTKDCGKFKTELLDRLRDPAYSEEDKVEFRKLLSEGDIAIVQDVYIENIMSNLTKQIGEASGVSQQNIKVTQTATATAKLTSVDLGIIGVAIAIFLILVGFAIYKWATKQQKVPKTGKSIKLLSMKGIMYFMLSLSFIVGGVSLLYFGVVKTEYVDPRVPVVYLRGSGPPIETEWDNLSEWKADQHQDKNDIVLETGDVIEWDRAGIAGGFGGIERYEVLKRGRPKNLTAEEQVNKGNGKWMIFGGVLLMIVGFYINYFVFLKIGSNEIPTATALFGKKNKRKYGSRKRN